MKPLDLGCTKFTHERIGIHAVINARGNMQHLNNRSNQEIEMIRDSRNITEWSKNRIRFYQFNSNVFRKRKEVQHYLSSYND